MKRSIYQEAKRQLKNRADAIKRSHPTDKPLICQSINNNAHFLCGDLFEPEKLRENISEAKYQQYCNWLHNYAATLHP